MQRHPSVILRSHWQGILLLPGLERYPSVDDHNDSSAASHSFSIFKEVGYDGLRCSSMSNLYPLHQVLRAVAISRCGNFSQHRKRILRPQVEARHCHVIYTRPLRLACDKVEDSNAPAPTVATTATRDKRQRKSRCGGKKCPTPVVEVDSRRR